MSKKSKSRIGFDPLVWMKNDARQSSVAGRGSTTKTDDQRPSPNDVPLVIPLGEELLIAEVGDRHREWKRLLAGARRLELDGTRLARVDTAGLQLLAALMHEAKRRGVETRWRGVSAGLQETAGCLGLKAVMNLA